MKHILAIAVLFSLSAFAASDDAGGEGETAAGSGAVNACFGGCDKDNFQRTLVENPEAAKAKYNEIFAPRGVITPEQMQKTKATKDRPIDI